jgi:hypothetical protein
MVKPVCLIWAQNVVHIEELMHAKYLLEKDEGKIPLLKPRHRWEENTKTGIKK